MEQRNFGKSWGECWWDYILQPQAQRVKRPDVSDGNGEMRVRIPPPERSLRAAVSPQLVAPVFSKSTANAAEDYMES